MNYKTSGILFLVAGLLFLRSYMDGGKRDAVRSEFRVYRSRNSVHAYVTNV